MERHATIESKHGTQMTSSTLSAHERPLRPFGFFRVLVWTVRRAGIVKAHRHGGQVQLAPVALPNCWQVDKAMSLDKGKPQHGKISERGKNNLTA